MLFLTALIWGVTFVAQKSAMDNLAPFMFNALRSVIGASALFLISFFIQQKRKIKRKPLIKGGLILGIFLFLGMAFQQIGIVTTSAGHAGFISSLYIVMVPLFSILLGKKVEKFVWLGVLLAILGLYFLCVKDGFKISTGDLTVLFSGVFFALHIVFISKYANKTDPIKLSCLQFLFAGIFSFFVSLIFEKTTILAINNSWVELLYAGVLSCAIGFTLQIVAQKHVRPYIASLILSLESVFALVAGFLFLNEIFSLRELFGCLLMFVAVFVAQFHSKKPIEK